MSQALAQTLHPLDIATQLVPMDDGRLRGTTSDDYWNMMGPFGGTTAAVLLGAALGSPKQLGDPVALTVNFCAPIAKGDFFVDVKEVRTNRSTQHWSMELSQGDGIAASATAVFAKRRETWNHRPARMPNAPPPATLAPMATEGRNAWLQRYGFRFVEGIPDFEHPRDDDPAGTRSVLWIEDVPARPLDFLSLAALTDIFFVRIFQVRGRMLPAGTVSMTSYFHTDAARLATQGTKPLLGVADARIFTQGYFDQSAELWSAAGHLLATSVQTVYYKD
ncbi:MAG: thioesterase family protein [Parvibaculum sp.]